MDGNAGIGAGFGIGSATPRFEDARLLRGLGRYVDDIALPGMAHMAVVRSPHASARIAAIDAAAARALPGVLAVLTGADLAADGWGTLHTIVERRRRDGTPMAHPPYRLLALDAVRFVGDAVAIVIAETAAAALDGRDAVAVDYDSQPAVTDVADAARPGAAAVWPADVPDNECFVFALGDAGAVAAGFAAAHHVSTLDFRISRVSANPMEPRSAIGLHDPGDDRFTLYAGTQIPHKLRTELAERTMLMPAHRLRVVSPDVGGAFGMKGSPYPEYGLVLWAARRLGRPVRWSATRSESFLSDYHARDNVSRIELALAEDGEFLALRIRTLANLGAYLAFNTPHAPTNNLGGLAGVYRTPAIHAEVRGLFTHTQPTAPYRGAGRPEATYALERVIDIAAREMGIDRIALRRRNLIPPEAMPFRTGLVFTYDSGRFAENMDISLRAADWDGFPARRAAAAARGKLRGIGIANAIEIAGGPFKTPNEEAAFIRFDSAGDVTVQLGTHSHGQGHETAFRQIMASCLGVAPDHVRILAGDTDTVPHGRGTFGSRSILAGGTAMLRAAGRVIARGRVIAAHLLEAAEADIAFEGGVFRVAGTDRSLRIEAVARASYVAASLPPDGEMGLAGDAIIAPPEATFPNGCHVCEVEIDPETGSLAVCAYVVADDVGTVVNPLLVKGQIHGGVAQGLGQILMEAIVYEPASGQLLSGSFMDYAMPRAADLPSIAVLSNPVPTPNNPLGAKGAGEAGTVGALPAIASAILDALAPLGVTDIAMPATPERIWQAIRHAERTGASKPQ
jgi:carbon-monoxide dehydrogenase large subunit